MYDYETKIRLKFVKRNKYYLKNVKSTYFFEFTRGIA
jgi:hypothetical protein